MYIIYRKKYNRYSSDHHKICKQMLFFFRPLTPWQQIEFTLFTLDLFFRIDIRNSVIGGVPVCTRQLFIKKRTRGSGPTYIMSAKKITGCGEGKKCHVTLWRLFRRERKTIEGKKKKRCVWWIDWPGRSVQPQLNVIHRSVKMACITISRFTETKIKCTTSLKFTNSSSLLAFFFLKRHSWL